MSFTRKPPTYPILQDKIEKLGARSAQSFVSLSKPKQKAHLKEMEKFNASISLATGVKPLSDKQLSSLVTNIAGNNKRKFGDAFRGVKPGHDEMLSTAQTFHMGRGIVSVIPKNRSDKNVTDFINLSLGSSHLARIKTEHVGFNYPGNQMQHPTQKDQGLFGAMPGKHNEMDRRRAELTLEHVNKKNKPNQAFNISLELVRSSMINTTNLFMAPTTASNQSLNKLSAENPMAAFTRREKVKNVSRKRNQYITKQKANAEWKKRDARDPSPPR